MSRMAVPAGGAPRRRLKVVEVCSESESGFVPKHVVVLLFVVVVVVDGCVLLEENVVLEIVEVVLRVGALAQLVNLK